jgi:bleomycin hydrolase
MTSQSNLISGSDGALNEALIGALRGGYEMDPADRARFNAITNAEINTLALNREVVRGEDGHFSHKIKTVGITNQKASGRCWLFAGLNVMRPEVVRGLDLEGFEFSTAYLQFWDKMEKSNVYFEQVIELRDADRLDREWQLIHQEIVGDGGWWNYVTALVAKYGAVPSTVMPETYSSQNTKSMNAVLGRLLRSRAVEIIRAHEEGADVEGLREIKERALADVYRFLALNLGEPPVEFEWRYETKKGKEGDAAGGEEGGVEQERLSELRRHTPQSFYDEHVGIELSDFVCLYHDAAQPTYRHFQFERARNVMGRPGMNFVNVEIGEMKGIAVKSVLADQPMWFAVDMGIDQSIEHGLMGPGLFDYDTLFGIEMPLSKAERARFHAGASNHAMVLMGVDLRDGVPCKWLVENSWGDEKGNKGKWTLQDRWFDEHVYTIIVHRDHVPAAVLAVFEEEAEVLPAWYPGAAGVIG